jgi:hypothetical protein
MTHSDVLAVPAKGSAGLMRVVAWTVAGALLGFATTLIFSDVLQLARGLFLLPYVAVVGGFVGLFALWHGIDFRDWARAWPLGVFGAVVVGFFVTRNVLGQPASAAPNGAELVWAIAWFGVVYGLVDALFLNVMPVMLAKANGPWRSRPMGEQILFGVLALAISAVFTAAYHLGFAEYRGIPLFAPLIGNLLLTLSYVLTRSPLAPIGAHIAMHIAGVLHGIETVVQLPPHY